MKRLILSLFIALAICLSLMPITVMAAAPSGQAIYIGGENVASGGYWTTDSEGNVTAYSGTDTPTDNYIHYDAGNNILTLHNATIKKELNYSESIEGGTYINGSGIGVFNRSGKAELAITLEGTNTIAEVSTGIYVLASSESTGDASLTITGNGSLDTSVSYNSAIRVQSNGGNATLSIENAKVTATVSSSGDGVSVRAGSSSSASLTVNGGGLTASGNAGIQFLFGSGDSGSGTPSLNVSNNAIVQTNGGISTNSTAATPSGTGIVFDNGIGTVYGSVTLQENITIGEGETLTIPDGASLNTGSHEVIVNGGTLTGGDKITGTVKYAPTITTESLPNGTVGTAYSQTLAATGSDTITWSINSGSLPDGLSLNSDTGEITGTPTTANSYSFTVKAENAYGSKTKELTITINDAKTYSVSVTPAKITLPSVKEGYDPQDPEYITIKNTGNQTILLEDHGENPWLTITLDKNTLKPNEEAKVSIKLIDGLSAETRSTLQGFITYTSEDGTYRDYAHFEVTYEIRHDMKHVEAKEATHLEEGNIEYWYCEYCNKYYDGALGMNELSLEDITIPKLMDHTATDTWYHDENSHWHTCECGEVLDKEAHEFKWVIDKEATATSEGLKHEECSICGYQKEAIVIPVVGTENQAPVINAKDQTLTVGDKFDPMKGVTATDQEDGDLTDKIVITKNTVDTSKVGKYTVDYEVTDNDGTRVRKTIVVTVKEKSSDQTTTTDSKKTNGTKTSAGLGIGLFSSLAGVSAVGAGILSVLKKRNDK